MSCADGEWRLRVRLGVVTGLFVALRHGFFGEVTASATPHGSIGNISEATYATEASHMVVDTGFLDFGKKRLIPAGVVEPVDADDHKVYVRLTKDDIKNVPDYDPTAIDWTGTATARKSAVLLHLVVTTDRSGADNGVRYPNEAARPEAAFGSLRAGRAVRLPLDKLHRLAGPPDAPVLCPVDDEFWGENVDDIERRVEAGWEPPPIIVTYQDDQLMVEDGNHRIESLRRSGTQDAWAVIGFQDRGSRDRFVSLNAGN